jgi:hypothetical protein
MPWSATYRGPYSTMSREGEPSGECVADVESRMRSLHSGEPVSEEFRLGTESE